MSRQTDAGCVNVDGLREYILNEIKTFTERNGGQPPGKAAFARYTGIGEHQWSGVLWARWSDALSAAGFSPNALQRRFDSEAMLTKIIEACRHHGRVPTIAEFKLARRRDPNFPSKGAIAGHFPTRTALLAALARRTAEDDTCHDIAALLPSELSAADSNALPSRPTKAAEGYVYLLKSGDHYKIGRSDELERRVKEIRVALPEPAMLAHAIRTDDPPGIEAYWHKRFAHRRANGEWFKLAADDVAAFKRRKFQ